MPSDFQNPKYHKTREQREKEVRSGKFVSIGYSTRANQWVCTIENDMYSFEHVTLDEIARDTPYLEVRTAVYRMVFGVYKDVAPLDVTYLLKTLRSLVVFNQYRYMLTNGIAEVAIEAGCRSPDKERTRNSFDMISSWFTISSKEEDITYDDFLVYFRLGRTYAIPRNRLPEIKENYLKFEQRQQLNQDIEHKLRVFIPHALSLSWVMVDAEDKKIPIQFCVSGKPSEIENFFNNNFFKDVGLNLVDLISNEDVGLNLVDLSSNLDKRGLGQIGVGIKNDFSEILEKAVKRIEAAEIRKAARSLAQGFRDNSSMFFQSPKEILVKIAASVRKFYTEKEATDIACTHFCKPGKSQ